MKICSLCPKNCLVNRKTQKGFCSVNDELMVARAALHFWEEPCISGKRGSGTVFFSGCSLKCVYCQNKAISRGEIGKIISVNRLSEIFLELQEKGANNINLVTPDHFTDKIIQSIDLSKKNGLNLPVVYNSSGYSKIETLKSLNNKVNIYLPDFKYFDDVIATKYSNVNNYVEIAKKNIEEMFEQVGEPCYNKDGIMNKGVIVRHLLLPGLLEDSKRVIWYLYKTFGNRIIISIMSQFTPINLKDYPEINRTVTNNEYNELVDFAIDIGVENAFIQDCSTAKESFIPDFTKYEGV